MIVTFYSYKGGVGRSMALANVADLLARSGLRVLMVDFDLEAPGLEHFFSINHDMVRGQEGLLDLLLTFKYSMSVASSGNQERDAFRQLDRFITTVYPTQPGSGGLDLIPAGRRLTNEQIVHYGVELRRFDWLDFYFGWSGELFFEWLRRAFADRYDVVLVDSRTGFSEMGGVCAYQLADVIVVLCAANLQNVEGTEVMVRHFLSPDVRDVRRDRPVDVLIVPARVDQEDTVLRRAFEQRFDERFASYLPAALADAGLTLWDLQIPYDPRYAFDEQVVTDPERVEDRRGLAEAYNRLLKGISLLAPAEGKLAGLQSAAGEADKGRFREPVETRYDPTTRFAAPDVFISFGAGSEAIAMKLEALLARETGLAVATSAAPQARDATITRASSELVQTAKLGLVLVGDEPDLSAWRSREIEQRLSRHRAMLPVLLPGASPRQIPLLLQDLAYLDFRAGIDAQQLVASVRAALAPSPGRSRMRAAPEESPYPGLQPFREEDSDVFFGRTEIVTEMLGRLGRDGMCTVVGPAGIGKTSVVFAGLIPAMRRGELPDSEHWPIVSLRPGSRPVSSLVEALGTLVPQASSTELDRLADDANALKAMVRDRFERFILIVDQLEELFTIGERSERDRFIQYLINLSKRGPTVMPVLVLRAEFLTEAASTSLAKRFLSSPVLVGALSGGELREAIEAPTRYAGLAFEPGLVDRLMHDLASEPGAMILLQFVLRELWREQRDGYLTHQSYSAMGGVLQALASRADEALNRLSQVGREIARVLLLRLVAVTDDQPHRRGPVEIAELTSGLELRGFDPGEVQRVVTLLTDHRLLATSLMSDGQVRVELAHEALLHAWPILAGWVREGLDAIRARSRLDVAAAEWQMLHHDKAALLQPERLEQLLSAMGDFPPSQLESAYARAVQAAKESVPQGIAPRPSWISRVSVFIVRAARPLLSVGVIGIAAAAIWLVWATWKSDHRSDIATFGSFAVAVAAYSGGLIAWAWRSRAARRGGESGEILNNVADLLAIAVKEQWSHAAREQGLLNPEPIPVRWRQPSMPFTGPVLAAIDSQRFRPLPGLSRLGKERLSQGQIGDLHAVFGSLGSGRLVVVGPPGSGKSGAAVLLVLAGLQYREQVPKADRLLVPVPVMFTLQGWDPTTESVQDWLTEQLRNTYPLFAGKGGSARATELIAAGRISVVLDGLDEMSRELRPVAMRALNQQAAFRIVVLARSREMLDTAAQVTLQGAVALELQEVDPMSAAGYLTRTQYDPPPPGWRELTNRLRDDPDGSIAKALSSPLTLTMIRDTYRGTENVRELLDFCDMAPLHVSQRDIEDHLLDRLLLAAYNPRPGNSPLRYNLQVAQYTLRYIAARMNEDSTRDLAWWRIPAWAPSTFRIVVTGLLCGLASGFLTAVLYGLVPGLISGLVIGLLAGFMYGRGGESPERIKALRWREVFNRSHILLVLASGLGIGIVCGLVVGLASGLASGISVGLASALASGLSSLLATGLSGSELTRASPLSPLTSWRRYRVYGSVVGLLFGLDAGLVSGLVVGISVGIESAIRVGLVAALIVQVFGLVYPATWPTSLAFAQLASRQRTPVRLMRFLEDARYRNVLRTVGPVYQFRNARLQDRLAAQESPIRDLDS